MSITTLTTTGRSQLQLVGKSSNTGLSAKRQEEPEPEYVYFSNNGQFTGRRLVQPLSALSVAEDQAGSFTSIPLVDISGLFSSSFSERNAVAQRLAEVCEGVGFAYLIGHRVPIELIEGLFGASRRYFDLPLEQKMEELMWKNSHLRGYEPLYSRGHDPRYRLGDKKEAFTIGYEPALDPHPPILSPEQEKLLDEFVNALPSELPWFNSALSEYFKAMIDLSRQLMRAFGLALHIGEEGFDRVGCMDYPLHSTMKVVHYPPHEEGSIDETGCGAHTDSSCFTLLQTSAPGLEVLNARGQWVPAPPIEGAFIMNVGDILMRLSNGRFLSTIHRVKNVTGGDRYSIPFFSLLNPGSVIEVLETCQSPENPAKFPAETLETIFGRKRAQKLANFKAKQTAENCAPTTV